MEKQCLYCDEMLRGRADKKFCDDHCRNAYNNQQNREEINLVRNINNALKRNRRILKDLNPEGKTRIQKAVLVAQGYNFGYYTNVFTTKNNNTYFFCYDYGYLDTQDGYLTLVLKLDWVV